MHKDLFSLTLTLSCPKAGATWPLGVKGKLTALLHPIPCLRVFPLLSQVQAKWRMPQLWMVAFDLQRGAHFPARLLQEGERPMLFPRGTGYQPLLPPRLPPPTVLPGNQRAGGPEEWESLRRQGGHNGTGETGLKPSESCGHTDTHTQQGGMLLGASEGGSSGCEPRKQETRSLQTFIFSILLF